MKYAALLLSLLVVACTSPPPVDDSPPADAGEAVGQPCNVTTDCVVGLLCGYPIEAGCPAQGQCVPEYLSCPMDGPTVCSCQGGPVGLACIYGPGFAVVPVPNATPGCMPDVDAFFSD